MFQILKNTLFTSVIRPCWEFSIAACATTPEKGIN